MLPWPLAACDSVEEEQQTNKAAPDQSMQLTSELEVPARALVVALRGAEPDTILPGAI
jgi:hypothetical protein